MDSSTFDPRALVALPIIVGLFAAYVFLVIYPYWRILRRLGYSTGMKIVWLLAFAILPVIAIWLFAFADWPAMRGGSAARGEAGA